MSTQWAQLWVLVGLLLLAAGCERPLATAVATANAAAISIEAAHETLARRYRTDQLEAARRVRGDRADATVRAEQHDRVAAVRRRYRPAWEAYGAARSAWLAAVEAIVTAQQAGEVGLAVDMAGILAALQELGAATGQLVGAVRALGDDP